MPLINPIIYKFLLLDNTLIEHELDINFNQVKLYIWMPLPMPRGATFKELFNQPVAVHCEDKRVYVRMTMKLKDNLMIMVKGKRSMKNAKIGSGKEKSVFKAISRKKNQNRQMRQLGQEYFEIETN